MIQCPKCKADTPSDSWYCDQCGEQLLFCPSCNDGIPRKGKRCTQCGTLLVTRDNNAQPQPQITQTPMSGQHPTASAPINNSGQQPTGVQNMFGNSQDLMNDIQKKSQQQVNQPQTPVSDSFNGNYQQPTTPPQGGSSTMRPQSQGSGTMRPQGNGTMRPTSGPQIPPSEPTRFVMIDDPSKIVTLKTNAIIGRTNGDYLDVFGSCPYVSSTHARITLHSSMRWLYCDLGSTNGTLLNGTQLEPNKNYLLKKGQTIEIGFVKFKVE